MDKYVHTYTDRQKKEKGKEKERKKENRYVGEIEKRSKEYHDASRAGPVGLGPGRTLFFVHNVM